MGKLHLYKIWWLTTLCAIALSSVSAQPDSTNTAILRLSGAIGIPLWLSDTSYVLANDNQKIDVLEFDTLTGIVSISLENDADLTHLLDLSKLSGKNIYTADGTLEADRVVSQDGHTLTLDGDVGMGGAPAALYDLDIQEATGATVRIRGTNTGAQSQLQIGPTDTKTWGLIARPLSAAEYDLDISYLGGADGGDVHISQGAAVTASFLKNGTLDLNSYGLGNKKADETYVIGVNANGELVEMNDLSVIGTNIFAGTGAGNETMTGNYNNFFGKLAGSANTTGGSNNFFGFAAGSTNTTGGNNNFFGPSAGYANTTGGNNNFFGYLAGYANTTGGSNNFFGYAAGSTNTTGGNNNFFGPSAGYANTTGGFNNFFGYLAGLLNTTGGSNNFFGNSAGRYNVDGSNNFAAGTNAGPASGNGSFSNWMALGTNALITANWQIKLGTASHTTIIEGALMMKSPDGTCYTISVANGGALTTTSITCP